MLHQAFPIPGAPPDEVLVAYQAALVERARSFLLLRGSVGEDLEVRARAAVAELGRLREAHRFPLDDMVQALGLDALDRDALGLILAPHIDPTIREDLRRYRRDPTRGYVDGAVIVALYTASKTAALAAAPRYREDGLLSASGLVELVRPQLPFAPSGLELEVVPTPRLLGILEGKVVIDPSLRDVATLMRSGAAQAGPRPVARGPQTYVRISGPEGAGKVAAASAYAAAAGYDFVIVVDIPLLRLVGDWANRFRQLERETRLIHAALIVRHCHEAGDACAALRSLLERMSCTVIGTTVGEERVLPAGATTL